MLDVDSFNAATDTPLLKSGSRGPAVARAQILLDRAWYSVGEIDGRFAANMQRMVQAYQAARGLPASGVVNRETWEQLRAELALEPEECAHIGDDLPDLAVIVRCGLAATVPHAPEALQRRAHYVTRAEGGAGAVRELAELILAAQGKLAELLNAYGDQDALAAKPKLRRL